ncbi:MAG TPA: hypothetical protein VMQ99_03955 [Acetobacteraceae bacterium]|nr:hypothetical protein [Acetobacteraceae bacterium]
MQNRANSGLGRAQSGLESVILGHMQLPWFPFREGLPAAMAIYLMPAHGAG